MSSVVFLVGMLCIGPVEDQKCVNLASQYLYENIENCLIANQEIRKELGNIDGLSLTCVPSELIERFVEFRPSLKVPKVERDK